MRRRRQDSRCFFIPAALEQALNGERTAIRRDLHTIPKPLGSSPRSVPSPSPLAFTRCSSGLSAPHPSLRGVCLVLSDLLGCADGRLNVRSYGRGHRCLTSLSRTASPHQQRALCPPSLEEMDATRLLWCGNNGRPCVCLHVYSLVDAKHWD